MVTRAADNVFINCPFDDEYIPLLRAMVFAIHDSGFVARCAVELNDATQNRLDKIMGIVEECRFGIHDISRTELSTNGLPRFNMPLELGIFLGAERFGDARQHRKACLVLDRTPYRYQKFISDIAGQDVVAHRGSQRQLVAIIRNWLRDTSRRNNIPGGAVMNRRYDRFRRNLPAILADLQLAENELTYNDYAFVVVEWLKLNTNP